MRVFAIGDIHGCCKTFQKLLFEEIDIQRTDRIYCVGDYIDRGPDSRGVIDTILALREQGYEILTLRGNHEQLMLDSEESPEGLLTWMLNGGEETLKSFDVTGYDELEDRYKAFFNTTEFYFEWDRFILVHAGLDFSGKDPLDNTHAMLWIRKAEIDTERLGDRVIVHGHTPQPLATILNQSGGQMIDLDAGCVYAQREGMGNLVALELQTMKFRYTPNIDY